jgi:fructose-specific phosphotransferase system IIC component
MALLFISPLLAGVSGLTVRLVFDLKEGAVPLTSQSAITTAALGLIAGGVAGLLFITAQVTTATAPPGQIVSIDQARRLVAFSVLIGFVAGLTLDAVFRKLIATDVVETSAIEAKARS